MGKFMGHDTPEALARAIAQEGERMGEGERRAVEERERREVARVSPVKGAVEGPMREAFSYSGEPGSEERWQQVKALYPELASDADRLRALEQLKLVVHSDAPDAREVARLVVALDDPNVYGEVRELLDGTDALDQVDELVMNVVQKQLDTYASQQQEQQAESVRERQEMLRSELGRMHPSDADAVVRTVPDLTELEPEDAALQMRAVEAMSASQRDALSTLNLLGGISRELKHGIGSPGSRWNDESRGRWEAELDEATLHTSTRDILDPETAAAVAEHSLTEREGPSPGLRALMGELHKNTYAGEAEHLSEERDRERAPDKYAPSASHDSMTTKQPTRTGPTTFES